MQRNTFRSLLLLVALFVPAIVHAKDFALIANKANEAKNLTTADLAKLFKPGASNWPSGVPMILVLRSPAATDMKMVVQKLGAAEAKDLGPRLVVVNSDEEVVQTVARTPGAIGIVDVYSITGEVNVVKLEGKLPLEQGYALHIR